MFNLLRVREGICSVFCRHPEETVPDTTPAASTFWDPAGDLHADIYRALQLFRKTFNNEICTAQAELETKFAPGSSECRARSRILRMAHSALNRTADAIGRELDVMVDTARGIDGLKTLVLGAGDVEAR